MRGVECSAGPEGGFIVTLLSMLQNAVSEHLEGLAVVLVALLGAGTILLAILNWRAGQLLRQYRSVLGGSKGGSLEGLLREYDARARELEAGVQNLHASVEQLRREARRHLQGVGVVRFDAFDNTGGNQSFAIALADELGNGVVFSSIHGRDETRMYAKPLEKGSSSYALSSEELSAVEAALRRRP